MLACPHVTSGLLTSLNVCGKNVSLVFDLDFEFSLFRSPIASSLRNVLKQIIRKRHKNIKWQRRKRGQVGWLSFKICAHIRCQQLTPAYKVKFYCYSCEKRVKVSLRNLSLNTMISHWETLRTEGRKKRPEDMITNLKCFQCKDGKDFFSEHNPAKAWNFCHWGSSWVLYVQFNFQNNDFLKTR